VDVSLLHPKSGDFAAITGFTLADANQNVTSTSNGLASEPVHGTTVIAVKFKDGVLTVGDRRATGGNAIMYDKAEKVLALDDTMLMAISGAFSKAIEFVRFLRHSFKYYERSQLQPLSLDGKLNEIGRLMAGNLAGAMSGGLVVPVIAVYDHKQAAGRIFFYDAAGARFENLEYAAAGSGSVQIRGAFEYIVRTKGNFSEMTLESALAEALHLLEIAADLDSATGGAGKVLPLARTVTAAGVTEISDDAIRAALGASTTTATSI